MSSVFDQLAPTPLAGTLQSVSLLFSAGQLALGALRPPFKTQVGPRAGSSLDVVTFDATLQETQTLASEVTEHPVEQGADISDHVRPKPIEIRIQGIISDTPLDDSLVQAALRAVPGVGLASVGVASVQALLANSSVVREVYNSLTQIRDSGQLVIVYTKHRSYTSMVLTELTFSRDPRTGDALVVSLAFREVITVDSAVTVATQPAMAQAALDAGTQATSAASAKVTKNVSVLYSTINSATNGGLDAAKTWMTQ